MPARPAARVRMRGPAAIGGFCDMNVCVYLSVDGVYGYFFLSYRCNISIYCFLYISSLSEKEFAFVTRVRYSHTVCFRLLTSSYHHSPFFR